MSDITKTPSWIETAQQARALREEAKQRSKAEAAKKQEDEKVARTAREAACLKEALAMFGINASPTENSWIQDSYHFYATNDQADDAPFATSPRDNQVYARFTLYVGKTLPPRHEDYPVWKYSTNVNCKGVLRDSDWSSKFAELADALLEVDRAVEAELEERKVWLEELEENKRLQAERAAENKRLAEERAAQPVEDFEPEPQLPESDADQLMKLLRSIMREIFEEEAYG